jgi:riboflavin synthase
VDGVGHIRAIRKLEDAWIIEVRVPDDVAALLVPHGSICVDGVSLTVNDLPDVGVLGLSIIEYTWLHTTLSDRAPGDAVHLESDVIGKFVRHLVQPYLQTQATAPGAAVSSQILGAALGVFRNAGQ